MRWARSGAALGASVAVHALVLWALAPHPEPLPSEAGPVRAHVAAIPATRVRLLTRGRVDADVVSVPVSSGTSSRRPSKPAPATAQRPEVDDARAQTPEHTARRSTDSRSSAADSTKHDPLVALRTPVPAAGEPRSAQAGDHSDGARAGTEPEAIREVPGASAAATASEGPTATAASGARAGAAVTNHPVGGSGSEGAPSGAGNMDGAARAQHATDEALLVARLRESAVRCYPEAARRFRMRGAVTLDFCLTQGTQQQATVARSSGQPLLDRAATECVLPGALPVAHVSGCFTVPIRFGEP